jgi:bacteriorhodopsin
MILVVVIAIIALSNSLTHSLLKNIGYAVGFPLLLVVLVVIVFALFLGLLRNILGFRSFKIFEIFEAIETHKMIHRMPKVKKRGRK